MDKTRRTATQALAEGKGRQVKLHRMTKERKLDFLREDLQEAEREIENLKYWQQWYTSPVAISDSAKDLAKAERHLAKVERTIERLHEGHSLSLGLRSGRYGAVKKSKVLSWVNKTVLDIQELRYESKRREAQYQADISAGKAMNSRTKKFKQIGPDHFVHPRTKSIISANEMAADVVRTREFVRGKEIERLLGNEVEKDIERRMRRLEMGL